MPKRPKEVKKIEVEYLDLDDEEQPECYGAWEETCDEKVCGMFFGKCRYHTETEPF